MIYGIGTDMADIERISRVLQGRSGSRLPDRILTPAEREQSSCLGRPAEYLAGRFAAKEAVSKAFGCGIGRVLSFQDISVVPDGNGKPGVFLAEAAWERLGLRAEDTFIHLSITHERKLAAAFAVVEIT